MIRPLVILSLLAGLTPAAQASDCFQAVKKFRAVQYVPANVYYFVGAPLRYAAVQQHSIKQQLAADPVWKEFQEFKRWKAQQHHHGESFRGGETGDTAMAPEASVMAARCAKCHSGEDAHGGLDVTLPITKSQKGAIFDQVWLKKMPPPDKAPPLTAEEMNGLLNELSKIGGDP